MQKSLGIIGFGAFSRFIAPILTPYFRVYASSRRLISNPPRGVTMVDLKTACNCDVVVISVTVQVLEAVLKKISGQLKPGCLVVDVCSVKVIPVRLMKKYLPKNIEILATHPVFGPQSGKNGIKGLPIAVSPIRMDRAAYQKAKRFFSKQLGLNVIEITPNKHDKEMAYALALTHLVSRAFNTMKIPKLQLPTKSYKLMLAIKDNLSEDSMELFQTIQNYNPFAEEVRKKFVQNLDALETKIEKHKHVSN